MIGNSTAVVPHHAVVATGMWKLGVGMEVTGGRTEEAILVSRRAVVREPGACFVRVSTTTPASLVCIINRHDRRTSPANCGDRGPLYAVTGYSPFASLTTQSSKWLLLLPLQMDKTTTTTTTTTTATASTSSLWCTCLPSLIVLQPRRGSG